jgi:hypothetical protein
MDIRPSLQAHHGGVKKISAKKYQHLLILSADSSGDWQMHIRSINCTGIGQAKQALVCGLRWFRATAGLNQRNKPDREYGLELTKQRSVMLLNIESLGSTVHGRNT